MIITVNNTMRKTIFFILTALFFSGCSKDNDDEKYNRIVAELKGKYKPIEIKSDFSVDINGDGNKSTDLMSEIENLNLSEFQLRVSGTSSMYYDLFWQEPTYKSKSTGNRVDPETYSNDLEIDYANQSTSGVFEVNDSFNTITFIPSVSIFKQDIKPDPAQIKSDGIIVVSVMRKLLTTDGWRDLKVTGTYKRYSNSY